MFRLRRLSQQRNDEIEAECADYRELMKGTGSCDTRKTNSKAYDSTSRGFIFVFEAFTAGTTSES